MTTGKRCFWPISKKTNVLFSAKWGDSKKSEKNRCKRKKSKKRKWDGESEKAHPSLQIQVGQLATGLQGGEDPSLHLVFSLQLILELVIWRKHLSVYFLASSLPN